MMPQPLFCAKAVLVAIVVAHGPPYKFVVSSALPTISVPLQEKSSRLQMAFYNQGYPYQTPYQMNYPYGGQQFLQGQQDWVLIQ